MVARRRRRKKKKEIGDDKFLVTATSLWEKVEPYLRVVFFVGAGVLVVLLVLAIITRSSRAKEGELWAELSNSLESPFERRFFLSAPKVDTKKLEPLIQKARGTDVEPFVALELVKGYLDQSEPEKALSILREGKERFLKHRLGDIFEFLLGVAYLEAGKVKEAYNHFEGLVEEDSVVSLGSAWYAGLCAEKLGKKEKARTYYERANLPEEVPFWSEMAKFKLSKLGYH